MKDKESIFDLDVFSEEAEREADRPPEGVENVYDTEIFGTAKGTEEVDEDFEYIAEKLGVQYSDEQRASICHHGTPLNVIACAGSGKTTSLITKMHYNTRRYDVRPSNMLAISFSNKAVEEMKERYEKYRKKIGVKYAGTPAFRTYHSLFLMLLKGLPKYENLQVADLRNYRFELLKKVRSDGLRDTSEILDEMLNYCSNLINKSISMDGLENLVIEGVSFQEDNYREVITTYHKMKAERKEVDFDDMMVQLYKELKANTGDIVELKTRFQAMYQYVFMDEYQDISKIQRDIMDNLIGDINKLTVYGDDDQSIYAFRGSESKIIVEFIYHYPSATRIFLGDNYRCGRNILNVLKSSIEQNKVRVAKDLRAYNAGGEVIAVPTDGSYEALAKLLVDEVKELDESEYTKVGILVRTNAQRTLLSDMLLEAGIAVDIDNMNYSLRNNKVYKTILEIIGAIDRGENAMFALHGRKFIPALSNHMFNTYKHNLNRNWYEEVVERNDYNLPKDTLEALMQIKQTNNMKNKIGYTWKLVRNYYENLAKRGFGNFDKTMNIVKHMLVISKGLRPNDFEKVERKKEALLRINCKNSEALKMYTIHAVKGQEFDSVYAIGLDSNIIPDENYMQRLYMQKGEEGCRAYVEEERRIFYVMGTRAKNKLVLAYDKTNPSAFLYELNGIALEGVNGEYGEDGTFKVYDQKSIDEIKRGKIGTY